MHLRGVREAKKRAWGALKKRWAPHHLRDEVVDFIREWSEVTEIAAERFVAWIGLGRSKFFHWKGRYGLANEHNCLIPRDHWLETWEKEAILAFHDRNPLEGYRRLTFMMLDADICAVSPASTYRVLKAAGRLSQWNRKLSKKGTGFVQPEKPHQHWHIDVSYINASGTFYYLCTVLDGASRAVVHHEILERMLESDIELILQRALEKYPDEKPRVISDNGPQFIAGDFKKFIRLVGMTHVKTSPYYPQSNGKIERWHKTLKKDAIRLTPPQSLEHAQKIIAEFVHHYNAVRLHSAIGYITPNDYLAGKAPEIWAQRDRKLEAARDRRRARRLGQQPLQPPPTGEKTDWAAERGGERSECQGGVTPADGTRAVFSPSTSRDTSELPRHASDDDHC